MTTKPDDYAGAIYSTPPDATIPVSESGALRVMAITEPCKTSKELEACEVEILLEQAEAEVGGYSLIEFVGADGLPEVFMSDAERDALREQYTPEEWDEINSILQHGV